MSEDEWPASPVASTSKLDNTTPIRRQSRSSGLISKTYNSFTRTLTNSQVVEYEIGDGVVLAQETPTRQRWLGNSSKKSIQKIGADGLREFEKVAVIIGLHEDERGVKMARLRWFVRPKFLLEDIEEEDDVHVNELYYVADSIFVEERQARNDWTPGSAAISRRENASLSTESIPLSYIRCKAMLLSEKDYNQEKKKSKKKELISTFLVKTMYDAKPLDGGEFFGPLDWNAQHSIGMLDGDWDPEPVLSKAAKAARAKIRSPVKKPSPIKKVVNYTNVSSSDSDEAPRRKKSRPSPSLDESDDGEEDWTQPVVERAYRKSKSSKNARTVRLAIANAGNESQSDQGSESDSSSEDEECSEMDEEDLFTLPEMRDFESEDEGSVIVNVSPSKNKRKSPTKSKNTKKSSVKVKEDKARQPRLSAALVRAPAFEALSTFEKARALLHVGATPDYLPCREEEREDIRSRLGDAIQNQTGTCLYISGIPGTGKTATVRNVIQSLQEDEEMEQFEFLEINGMKITEPNQAFSQLWEFLSSGKKAAPRAALTQLENHFQTPDMRRRTTVVLVDELDQMVTKKQDVIYNFFNWPHVPHSKLVVIAIANTMDLPERELSGKIRSRLGSNRINFKPYDFKQLDEILHARIEGLEVFDSNAILFAAKKVAGVSGDARRALDISRRTVEKVDQINTELTKAGEPTRLCTIDDVKTTYNEMTNYGTNFFLNRLGFHQKIMMLAVVQCTKRAGVPDVTASDVISWHLDFLRQTAITPIPSHEDLFTSLANLHTLRLISSESQRLDYFQKVRSLVEDSDIFTALKEEPQLKRHVPRFA